METERSMSLLQCMNGEGLVPSQEEEEERKITIEKLRKIVVEWTKRVAFQRRLPRSCTRAASATILVYGSYGLGVHASDSDIDALCVGPSFATITEDFFVVLRNMLASRNEVSEILCIKNARVPLMRFKFDGITIDLPYAKLNINAVPENLDVLDPFFVANIDEISSRSLSGVRANAYILQFVTDHEVYKSLLRFIKCWAKRRGIYGHAFGFFGGIHLAILVAFVCWRHPKSQLSAMVVIFFETFSFWPWPAPVILGGDGALPNPQNNHVEKLLMPIQLPCSPNQYCHCNITKSTFKRIRIEFLHAHNFTKDIMIRPEFDWRFLIAPFSYAKKYAWFLKIRISSSQCDELGDWVGWVKSRIHCLLIKVEELLGICDPNPTEYVDAGVVEPNVAFYWGLCPGRKYEKINIESIKEDFTRMILIGCECSTGMLDLAIVKASEVPNTGCIGTRPWWRILDHNQQKVCLYSRHVPEYFVGYSAIADENEAC